MKTEESSGEYNTIWELRAQDAVDKWTVGQVNITGKNIVIEAIKNQVHSGFAAVDEFLILPDLDKCNTEPPQAYVPTPEPPSTTSTSTTSSGSGKFYDYQILVN